MSRFAGLTAIATCALIGASAIAALPAGAVAELPASTPAVKAESVTPDSGLSFELASAPKLALPKQAFAPTQRSRITRAEGVTTADVLRNGVNVKVGDSGRVVTDVTRRLNNVGIQIRQTNEYSSRVARAVQHFQWKFFLDTTGVLNRPTLLKLTQLSRGGDHVRKSCKNPKLAQNICVDLTQKVLRFYQRGKLRLITDVRSGSSANRTRQGQFHIFRKVVTDWSSQYNTPMWDSMYFSGGQALHYSMYFNRDGYDGASHGCLNIHDRKTSTWMYAHAPVGTGVLVYA